MKTAMTIVMTLAVLYMMVWSPMFAIVVTAYSSLLIAKAVIQYFEKR